MIEYKAENLLNVLVAAETMFSGRLSVSLITPYELKNDGSINFYWGTGPSRCSAIFIDDDGILEGGQARIVYAYHDGYLEKIGGKWYYDWDKVDLHFLNTFYAVVPQTGPTPDENGSYLGFICPAGKYYVAQYGNHDSTARAIFATLYKNILSGREAREALLKDWVQILGPIHLTGRDDTRSITTAQLETARKIEALWDKADFHSLEFRTIVD